MSLKIFDEEFLSLQDFLSKLIPETVLITPNKSIPSDPSSLIHLLYQQTKIYARKILDLYETLDQNFQEDPPAERTVFESADFQSNLSPIKVSHAQYERTIEALTKERESLLLCLEKYKERPIDILETIEEYDLDNKEEMVKSLEGCFNRKDGFLNGCRILQNIDYEIIRELDGNKYINWLIIANRMKDQYMERIFEEFYEKFEPETEINQVFKHKDFFHLAKEIELGLKKYEEKDGGVKKDEHLQGKIEYLNAEIVRLNEALDEKLREIEKNDKKEELDQYMRRLKEVEDLLENEKKIKQTLEIDLTELLEEFKLMKEKFEDVVKENEKLKEQNEFSEKMEDYEKLSELIHEKDSLIQKIQQARSEDQQVFTAKTEEYSKAMLEKDVMMQKIISEKDNLNQKLLQPQISYDQSGLNSIIIDLELRITPLLNPLLQDQNQTETFIFRLNSLKNELSAFYSLIKDLHKDCSMQYQKNFHKDHQLAKSPQILKNSQLLKDSPQNMSKDTSIIMRDSSKIENYWKSVVSALSNEKEELLRKLEKFNNNYEIEGLQNKLKELEESLNEKNSQGFPNENYYKSLIISLSSEKELLLKRLESLNNKENNTESLQNRIKELEEVLQEKNSQINGFNEIIEEWQLKYSRIEQDIHENGLDALTKEETYERELLTLKEQLSANEKLLSTREAEILDYCQTLSQRTEKQKALENENRRLIVELNEIKLKYSQIQKDYEECQGYMKNIKEEMNFLLKNKDLALLQEQKLVDLNTKFEDFKTRSFDKISTLAQELERTEQLRNESLKGFEVKNQENAELIEMMKEIEQLSESQGKTLGLKETQIENLETKVRLLENERVLLEKKTQELVDLKNRNKRCLETISSSSNEINGLKKDMENLISSQKALDEKLFEKETIIIDLNHQIKGLKSQIEKNLKILDEKEKLINELNHQNKALKPTDNKVQKIFEEKLFEKETVIIDLNQQIKNLKLNNSHQKAGDEKLFEKETMILDLNQQIKGLKGQLDRLCDELELTRKERDKVSNEYQRLIERNEKLMMESDKFLTVDMLNKDKNCEEFEERTAFLDVTNMQMMKNFKEGLENTEKQIGSYRPPKKIIEERDIEIKRLSKIVKTLSNKCLNESIYPSQGQKGLKR